MRISRSLMTLGIPAAASVLMTVIGFASSSPARPKTSRAFELTYTVRIKELSGEARRLRLWIPVPVSDDQQEISALAIRSPVPYRMGEEKEYHDRYAYLDLEPRRLTLPLEIETTFRAVRHENRVGLDARPRSAPARDARPPDLARSLQPDRLVPLDGLVADLTRKQTISSDPPLARAKAIYDYVLSTMRYDKSGEGWGRGDVLYACNMRRGNCTDFHALLIGMMRAAGIPARFEIGFPLPRDRNAGEIPGYHCWAEFWLDGTGWVPVDASEAWKDPSRRDYFFGAHDANRILLTRGRDVRLDPAQRGDPLNYFVYPYAELDGRPWSGLETSVSFQDLETGGAAGAPAAAGRRDARHD